RRVVRNEHVEPPVVVVVDPADAACPSPRIRRARGAGDIDEAAARVLVEPVRLRAAAAFGAEADVEVGPAVAVHVSPARTVLGAPRTDAEGSEDVLEAAVPEVPVERGARAVVADVDVDAPVAVEVRERGVIGRDGAVETGRPGDVGERRLGRSPAAD